MNLDESKYLRKIFRKGINMDVHQSGPLLVVTIMIKNEAESIEKTLLPFVEAGIKHICVFDTGSTDNTLEVVNKFYLEHAIEGCIHQEEFIDFATSRNRALQLAENHFPNAIFMIMPDAEWYLENGKGLLNYLEKIKDMNEAIYLIKLQGKTLEFFSARVMRVSAKNRFVGVVHEVLINASGAALPHDVFFKWIPSNIGKEKSRLRWERDAILLLKEHEKNPTDPRTAFYLAQTYDCLDDYETALKYYQIREKITGWDEENFITVFRIAILFDKLSKINEKYTWSMALEYYLKAFGMRPTRTEPLVKIADHYWPDNIPACYLFSRYASKMPYPKDILFVEKEMYDYTRYEILSRCAWYMQEFSVGKDATKRALKVYPQTEHLKRNLELYEKQINI